VRIVLHTADTPSSVSAIIACLANLSNATVRLAIPPPANGSTNISGDGVKFRSQARIAGTNHVLPPGYLKGLR
jgi:hypothetical protein